MRIRVAKEMRRMKKMPLFLARESRNASEALEQKSNSTGGTETEAESERHRPGGGGGRRTQETALPEKQGGRGLQATLPDFGIEVLTPAPAENP